MLISPTGYWLTADVANRHFDELLCAKLISYFRGSSVVDLGCGAGHYVRAMRAAGIDAIGCDGNPNTERFSDGLCFVHDLTCPLDLQKDYVLTLEVGEHIPEVHQDAFIENVHRNNRRGCVVSWAIKGQPGIAHVNCRDNEYIIEVFTGLGYEHNYALERLMRQAAVIPWFKNTVMVFERKP